MRLTIQAIDGVRIIQIQVDLPAAARPTADRRADEAGRSPTPAQPSAEHPGGGSSRP